MVGHDDTQLVMLRVGLYERYSPEEQEVHSSRLLQALQMLSQLEQPLEVTYFPTGQS